jgi:hypothetical protein
VLRSAMKFPSEDQTLNQGIKDLLAHLKVKSGKILTCFKEFSHGGGTLWGFFLGEVKLPRDFAKSYT